MVAYNVKSNALGAGLTVGPSNFYSFKESWRRSLQNYLLEVIYASNIKTFGDKTLIAEMGKNDNGSGGSSGSRGRKKP